MQQGLFFKGIIQDTFNKPQVQSHNAAELHGPSYNLV